MNMTITLLWQRFLTEVSLQPKYQHAFLAWAATHCPDDWARFAASRGRDVSDPELVTDAAVGTSRLMIEAVRGELDKMAAVMETQQILSEGSGNVV